MKINELLKKRPTLSFEIFPPKNNENDITSIYATIDELAKMNPDFISVTYGANGSTSKNTCKIASTVKNKYGIEYSLRRNVKFNAWHTSQGSTYIGGRWTREF